MDLILSIKIVSSTRNGIMLELAIYDRNYKTLFNERFKTSRKRKNGISYDADYKQGIYNVKECGYFRDRVEEIKSILCDNRVIIFDDKFNTRQLLVQQCKEERIDHSWVNELSV